MADVEKYAMIIKETGDKMAALSKEMSESHGWPLGQLTECFLSMFFSVFTSQQRYNEINESRQCDRWLRTKC